MAKEQDMIFVPKGWGWERWIVNNEKYCGKLLYIAKGRKFSWHYHKLKEETFYLHSGKVFVRYCSLEDWRWLLVEKILPSPGKTWEDFITTVVLRPGDKFHVSPGLIHQVVGVRDSELFEFSTQHFDEDSYRIYKGD